MYQAHWGLKETPFHEGLNTRAFYVSSTHEEALARLHFLVEEGQRVGLLLGQPGCGKSLLLEVLSRDLGRRGFQVTLVSLAGLDTREFLWQVAAGWGLSPELAAERFSLWRSIQDRLIENRYQERPTILLLDDAHDVAAESLAHVLRMLHADTHPAAKLSIILAADPYKVEQLGTRLLDLVDLRVDLEAWDAEDTSGYLTSALVQAGRSAPVFTLDGIRKLHDLTDGVPRHVKQLAQLALLAGAGQKLHRIDAATVEAVHEELGVIRV